MISLVLIGSSTVVVVVVHILPPIMFRSILLDYVQVPVLNLLSVNQSGVVDRRQTK